MKKFTACALLTLISLSVGISLGAAPSVVELKARTFTPEAGTAALDIAEQEGMEMSHFLVQLDRFADAAVKAQLEGAGVRLLAYIPQNTWIAAFDRGAIENQDLRPSFVWVGEILATDKMPVRWEAGQFGEWAIQPDGRLEMRVRFHEDVDRAAAAARLQAIGAELVAPLSIFNGYTILGSVEMTHLIAEMDEVLWVNEGLPEKPEINNDSNRVITNAEILQGTPYELSGSSVHVGIWDAGLVDANHDDFAGRLILGEGGGVHYHATHCAGTVAGSGILSETEGGTPLQWRGMAPEAILFSWNFYGDVPQEIVNGIADYDLDLETNSWNWGIDGSNCYLYGDYDSWAPEFDEIVRGEGGRTVNVTFSAANERDDGDCDLLEGQYACIPPPATAKNVITVGATNSDDDTITGFSSFGPVDDGRLKPDLTAPGCQRYGDGAVTSTEPGDIYNQRCGTSMAAPTVAGNLALLYHLYDEENGGADPEPTMMKALLIATGQDLGNPGPDYAFGHGRIDVKAAADALLNDTQVVFSIASGEHHEFRFPVPPETPYLRLALVWADPPGNPLADPALVNDLDLVLLAPNGGLHLPWVLNPDAPSQNATRGVDHLNNVEHVHVDNPTRGTWTARVSCGSLPEGPQLVSLVGLDVKAPGAPMDFIVAEAGETSLDLTWTNAGDGDLEGTVIARWEGTSLWLGPYPGATYTVGDIVAPGVEIIYVADEDHSATPFVDTDLTPGHTYKYVAYTFDDMHNFSAASHTEGTVGDPAGADEAAELDANLVLGPARPNPADTQMGFSFSLPSDMYVQVRFYDSTGRLVRTLVGARMSAGIYSATWHGLDDAGRPVAPGVYFYELRANGQRLSRQVSWMR